MIRSLVSLVIFVVLAYVATTVGCGSPNHTTSGWPYGGSEGKLTFVGHVRAIWHTEEVQDLKKGIQDEAGPAADKLKKKVHEATE
jgi:hypothetical protein